MNVLVPFSSQSPLCLRARPEAREVRPHSGLRHRHRAHRFPGAEHRQPPLLLLPRCKVSQIRRDDVSVDAYARCECDRDGGELLAEDGVEAEIVDIRAPVLGRDAEAEKAELSALRPQLARDRAQLPRGLPLGLDAPLDESGYGFAEPEMFLAEESSAHVIACD